MPPALFPFSFSLRILSPKVAAVAPGLREALNQPSYAKHCCDDSVAVGFSPHVRGWGSSGYDVGHESILAKFPQRSRRQRRSKQQIAMSTSLSPENPSPPQPRVSQGHGSSPLQAQYCPLLVTMTTAATQTEPQDSMRQLKIKFQEAFM